MLTILTYDAPHRKTQDVCVRLFVHKISFRVVAVPWIERKPRRFIYAHRPAEMTWPCDPIGDVDWFVKSFGVDYTVCEKDNLNAVVQDRLVVIGGAGILPKEFVDERCVLNVHPGLLPASRGLDILKWDVCELNKVGVTAHICDDETDLGWKVKERRVPVFRNDTFHSFAMRQYEMELALIPEALSIIGNSCKSDFEKLDREGTVARRRMNMRMESCLLESFERFKLVYAK